MTRRKTLADDPEVMRQADIAIEQHYATVAVLKAAHRLMVVRHNKFSQMPGSWQKALEALDKADARLRKAMRLR